MCVLAYGGQRLTSGFFLKCSPYYFLNQVISLSLELISSNTLAGQCDAGIHLSPVPQYWMFKCLSQHPTFSVCPVDWNSGYCACTVSSFIHCAIVPAWNYPFEKWRTLCEFRNGIRGQWDHLIPPIFFHFFKDSFGFVAQADFKVTLILPSITCVRHHMWL